MTGWNSLLSPCLENCSGTLVLNLVHPGTVTWEIPPSPEGTILGCKTEARGIRKLVNSHIIRKISDGEYYQQKVIEYIISCFLID